jgi:sirohydrochlorin ferrochelatase
MMFGELTDGMTAERIGGWEDRLGAAPDLVAAAHGTADPRGIREVHALVREMARLQPGLPISLGFVDVDVPALPGLVDRVVADSNHAIVVPLLLSSGYHVAVDILGQATRLAGQVAAAAALGPDPVLADILADRLLACVTDRPLPPPSLTSASAPACTPPSGSNAEPRGLEAVDRVVLAAAGSSNRRALLDCSATAAMLADRIDRPVEVGYVSGAGERLGPVLARTPGRVAVATYLLAPGAFADHVHRLAGARPVSAPLGADPRLAALALTRYQQALTQPESRRTRSFAGQSCCHDN